MNGRRNLKTRSTTRSKPAKANRPKQASASTQAAIQKTVTKKVKQAAVEEVRNLLSRQNFLDAGSKLGRAVGGLVSRVTGFGDYTIKSNSIVGSTQNPGLTFSNTNRGIRVRNTEFIDNVIASDDGTFTIRGLRINPADPATFPWLSTIATSFDQYKMHGLIFSYQSNSGSFNGTNQALGAVILGTEYDVADPVPNNRSTMENMQYSNSAKPSEDQIHGIECDPSVTTTGGLFFTGTPTDGEYKFYDLGTFYVATQGVNTGSPALVGVIKVTYDVELLKYQLPGVPGTVFGLNSIFGAPAGATHVATAQENTLTFLCNQSAYALQDNVIVPIPAGYYRYTVQTMGGTTLGTQDLDWDFYDPYNTSLYFEVSDDYKLTGASYTIMNDLSLFTGTINLPAPAYKFKLTLTNATGVTLANIHLSPWIISDEVF